jgi:hypothetical protein
MPRTTQELCLDKSCILLQELLYSGIITAPPTMIPHWYSLPDLESLDSSIILIDRLHFIWMSIEQSKVSLALHHNARMNACGYIYKGHDFGWNREPGRLSKHDQAWYSTATPQDSTMNDAIVAGFNIKYMHLMDLTMHVRNTTIKFRNSMSRTFGPMPCWLPHFSTYDMRLPSPLLPQLPTLRHNLNHTIQPETDT